MPGKESDTGSDYQAMYEAQKALYEAEVQKVENSESRDPGDHQQDAEIW